MITMTAVRQAVALIQDVHGPGGLEAHVARVARMASADPELFAVVAVALAAQATEDVGEGALLLAMNGLGLDLTLVMKDAHNKYEQLRSKRLLLGAPEWVLVGARLYNREMARRHQARRRAERQRAG